MGRRSDAGAHAPDATPVLDADTADVPVPSIDEDAGPIKGQTTTIVVHYPAGGRTLSLRGSLPPYNWDNGVAMTAGANDTWTLTTTEIDETMEWKPLIDDTTWSRGPNYTVEPGATVDIYPHFTQVEGTYSRAYTFTSDVLGNTRGIWIYEPPTYIENTQARMPVVYMHDGQNLFDPGTAFGGNEWQVDETMNAGAENGSIREAIIVGIENTAGRMSEYTPVEDADYGGGDADNYLRMIIEELKPRIDSEMRTLSGPADTAMVGSSLGGLLSSYAGIVQGDVFGLIGAMSPSTWWNNVWLVDQIANTPDGARPVRVYVDSGNGGSSMDGVTNTAALAAAYRDIGYIEGSTLHYVVQEGGQHNEYYWAQRLPGALAFLLGSGR